ncbi:HAUS augmin-like complex subunit 7 isoform X2 [Fundulus heteroclitus]|uniref:HAUS augmin-like complex subunit 7 isoform X2 n=1 Tax=Fundulus heteroclitus TaxID=8078 RepID=UPI00165BEC81|nr:HAUS augmin-like complex subunit 7 isoform X2 [Fundulus heteroclitus]
MAGVLTENRAAHRVYESLQALSCPLVQDLYLQEDESMLELLCRPSVLRTDILAWICCRINPKFGTSKGMPEESKDPDGLEKKMAVIGQELMLCKADDLDLIKTSAGSSTDAEVLLSQIFAAENTPHLRQMLQPALDPWPPHIEALHEGHDSAHKPGEELPDVSDLLQSRQTELEQLQSKCDFLDSDEQNGSAFSPSSLRLAAGDLQQQMMTFSHLYETDLRLYCSRDPPSFSADAAVFQRVHQKLLACNTELEMQREISEASGSVSEDVKRLQTQPRYWSRGEKHTLTDQLEEISQRLGSIVSQLHT